MGDYYDYDEEEDWDKSTLVKIAKYPFNLLIALLFVIYVRLTDGFLIMAKWAKPEDSSKSSYGKERTMMHDPTGGPGHDPDD